jgi:hypothetical protein
MDTVCAIHTNGTVHSGGTIDAVSAIYDFSHFDRRERLNDIPDTEQLFRQSS